MVKKLRLNVGSWRRELKSVTGAAVWYRAALPVVPMRWVLVRDPDGKNLQLSVSCSMNPRQTIA